MSGHSKWHNIQRRKNAVDGARAKIFTKIGREIMVCVREGGGDPAGNARLRDLIAKAKANNVPNENIDRVIKKAMGDGEKVDFESNIYEGYGPRGVAVIVETLTDNKNRTAGDVRHFFDKFGGNLGTSGCVSFMFTSKGIIVVNNNNLDEDKLADDIIEAGADDYQLMDDAAEIETNTTDVMKIAETLREMGYEILSADVSKIPSTYVTLTDEDDIRKMNLLLETLEENDDVQNVYHNWDEPDTDDED
jgi:YebC/PmpR family DNA-binding regulatory protein